MTELTDEELKAHFIKNKGVTKCPTAWNFGSTQYQQLMDDYAGIINLYDTLQSVDMAKSRKPGYKQRKKWC